MKKLLWTAMLALAASSLSFATGEPAGVPEIDANAAVSAVTLLSGALLLLRSRRKG